MSRRHLLPVALCVAIASAEAQQPAATPAQREQLETRLRREYTRVVKQRVGLSDDQLARLGPINQRFAGERRALQLQERDTRVAIQRAIRDTSARADTAALSGLLQRLVDIQKRRVQRVLPECRWQQGVQHLDCWLRPGGGIGRRRGLKILRPSGLASSSLAPGT
jgi:hypothetical protein